MSIQKYAKAIILGTAFLFPAQLTKAQVVMQVKTIKEANVKVYVTSYSSEADVVVFKAPFIKNAVGNKGMWYFTKIGGEANRRVCFVPGKEIADIVVFFTDDPKQAGWQNKRKKHFMD